MKAPATITDAWRIFNEMHGKEHPWRTQEELLEKIHECGLGWGENDEEWEAFWDEIFQEWYLG